MHAHPPPTPWSLRAACLSDVGRARQSNEDRCLIDLKRNLFIVSDGMGGQQAGGIASEVVVTVLPPLLDSLLRHGEITPEEAHNHPARGRLTRYIGMKEDVFPDVQTIPIQSGDRLLLCSDGLTGMVPGLQIEDLLRTNTEPDNACQALVEAANAAGGKDNITVLVVNCGEET